MPKAHKFSYGIALIFVLFFVNTFMPKGGFKINNIPITWGYLLLILSIFLFGLRMLFNRPKINSKLALIYLSSIPIFLYACIYFLLVKEAHLGKSFSLLFNTSVIPLFATILISQYHHKLTQKETFRSFLNMMYYVLLFVTIFGLFNFFYKIITDTWVEIPGITLNIHDVGQLHGKYNRRGNIEKLFSTYNNGNIFGVCMILLTPFAVMQKSVKRKNILILLIALCLVLTLSRTAWLGGLLLAISYLKTKQILQFLLAGTVAIGSVVIFTELFIEYDNFILDTKLGGRLEGILNVKYENIIFDLDEKFRGIYEVIFVGLLNNFGWLGFILFYTPLVLPVVLLRYPNKYNKIIMRSIVVYLMITFVDGAYNLIPVIFLFWFLVFLTSRPIKCLD